MASSLTPQLPLIRDFVHDFVAITSYKNLVMQNFKNLLLTNPGERIMDTNFGVGLNQFLFQMDNPALYSDITGRIHQQIKRYLPYIKIINITFDSHANNPSIELHSLFINIEYNIKPLNTTDNLELNLPDN